MGLAITEQVTSREWSTGGNPSCQRKFTVTGTPDDIEAKEFFLASTELVWNGLKRDACTMEPLFVDTVTGVGTWECEAKYVTIILQDTVNNSSYSFDTGGGTTHVTQALSTIGTYVASGTAPDFGGAIGVTADGVDGTDIISPAFHFSETHIIDDSDVDLDYKADLFYLTGRYNDSGFWGFAAGELLFLGASGSKRGSEDWEITFKFSASPNMTSISVGSITVPAKLGWEYLWVQYADEVSENRLVKRPISATVNRVYYPGNFSVLGI